jgi:hypothetical protein
MTGRDETTRPDGHASHREHGEGAGSGEGVGPQSDRPSLLQEASGGGRGSDWAARRRRRPHPPKMYRIGEVVSYSGLSRQTIHNYTTMGLLRESHWTPGGHRLFAPDVFDRLDAIAEMKARGYTLARIREHFAAEEKGSSAAG